MPTILNIDTTGSKASIALAVDGKAIAQAFNSEQRDHAAWIHQAISELLRENNLKPTDLSAIGVTIGPGSYTGLRVGLATAKGFCYALNIPLITENTLQLMAFHASCNNSNHNFEAVTYYIPMIDARRMEVFTAVYDQQLNEIVAPKAMIVDINSFEKYLSEQTVIFGNGALKFKNLLPPSKVLFAELEATAVDMSRLTFDKYLNKSFSDIVYCDPLYLKEFYTPEKKK